jgi:hypothetical protein
MDEGEKPHSVGAKPLSGWLRHPNLQKRPHSPSRGRGRLQIAVRRAFIGHPFRTSSQIYDWCYPRRRKRVAGCWQWSVYRILREIADRRGRASTIGRPWIWRLRNSQLPAEWNQPADIAEDK